MSGEGQSGDYWFNPATGEVEQGRQSPWTERMGPYSTKEAAEQALQRAAERTKAWDDDDRRWQEGR